MIYNFNFIKENLMQGARTLWLHRLRSSLSALGILFGVVAVITMLSIGEGAKRETLEQIEQLGIHNIILRSIEAYEGSQDGSKKPELKGLTVQDARSLEINVPGIEQVAAIKVLVAKINASLASITPEILAIEPTFSLIHHLNCSEGRLISPLDLSEKRLVCVLGKETAKAMGKEGHVGKTVRLDSVPFQIIGILKSRLWKTGKKSSISIRNLNKSILIPLGTETLLARNAKKLTNTVSEIILQLDPAKDIYKETQVIKRVLERLHGKVEDYQVIIPLELIKQAQQTHSTFNFVLGSIAVISLLVGGIGIMNIMLATVSERTREIGIRRAVGANQTHILIQFLSETLILTLIGAFLGVVFGVLFSFAIGFWAGWPTIVTTWSVLVSLIMTSAVGICSGLYPAWKASTMNPIKALRNE